MTRERYRQIDRTFAAVLERPPSERSAVLQKLCAGDPEMYQEVRSLLATEQESGDFLAAPLEPGGRTKPSPAAEDDGTEDEERVGPYRLLEVLGRGGAAVVYRAEHDGGGRPLALKLSQWSTEAADTTHFHREWRVLTQLNHPSIARAYDFGRTEDGRLYLVMERVDGTPLDRHCDERCLGVARRLELVREVCGAVDYAHRHGVIHRDLKPGNVLVTHEGKVKLLDFGIAKPLHSRTLRFGPRPSTMTGLRWMTPGYASPEQVEGRKLTRASDVYVLGVLLFELLAGASPYRLESTWPLPLEVVEALTEREPLSLAEALDRLDGDSGRAAQVCRARGVADMGELRGRLGAGLEAVVARALRKAPERRYATAAALADDVGRFLRGRMVRALLRHRLRSLAESPFRKIRDVFTVGGLGGRLAR